MNRVAIEQWYEEIQTKHRAHLISACFWDRWNNIIGFLAIVFGIVAGYKVTQGTAGEWWVITIGILAILAAVSNAALKFFGFQNRRQRHEAAAAKYAALQYEMEALLIDPSAEVTSEYCTAVAAKLSAGPEDMPLLSPRSMRKAEKQIKYGGAGDIPKSSSYTATLEERWKIEDGVHGDFGDNPIRTYECGPLEMCEFRQSNRVSVEVHVSVERQGKPYSALLEGSGIIEDGVVFLRYSFTNTKKRRATHGTMVLSFTNRNLATGYWMTAEVVGAQFLIGTIVLRSQ